MYLYVYCAVSLCVVVDGGLLRLVCFALCFQSSIHWDCLLKVHRRHYRNNQTFAGDGANKLGSFTHGLVLWLLVPCI